ncbi:MmcQ/YjbR family DNA-binding protein [Umezawaea sp. Da 62-37]|uniref:MmcQ/YjbR family DNA-binding protein n=1 Tax=Umezawaea sp. Da 62-37 TaxID=3075927 RepID=UPI0028F6D394|nr:MmcQ/YjbR family DNA-binding protein [Umezawaea sp. Da 62-37]WNV82125.1 MmcQ/YjbR family DNA-binding protein [Umezawaea sp. Da 62-37]
MATGEDLRWLARTLPRASEHLVRDRPKFRVGAIVYAALSPDERTLGFAFPKEERAALVAGEPAKFSMPRESDLRFNWVHGRMEALSAEELTELVVDAWLMVVPKKVGKAYLESRLPDVVP